MTVETKESTRDRVEVILEKYQRDRSWLVSILQDVQHRKIRRHYLSY